MVIGGAHRRPAEASEASTASSASSAPDYSSGRVDPADPVRPAADKSVNRSNVSIAGRRVINR